MLNTKHSIRFFEWLYFSDEHLYLSMPYKDKIVKVKYWNVFLIDKCYKGMDGVYNQPMSRMTTSPVWNWGRIKFLLFIRPFIKDPVEGEYYCWECYRPLKDEQTYMVASTMADNWDPPTYHCKKCHDQVGRYKQG